MKVVEAVVLNDSLRDDLGVGKEAWVLVQDDKLSSGTMNVRIDSQQDGWELVRPAEREAGKPRKGCSPPSESAWTG